MSKIIVEGYLPIEPGLLKYVQYREHLIEGRPLVLPGQSSIANMLTAMMSMAIIFYDEGRDPQLTPLELQALTARIRFEAHGPIARYEIFNVADRIALHFNSFLYSSMQDDVLQLVMDGKSRGKHEQDTIGEYLRRAGLDDYYEYDSMKKAQYRARKYRALNPIKGRQWAQQC